MKKKRFVSMALLVSILSGCTAKPDSSTSLISTITVPETGNTWYINGGLTAAEIPADAQNALDQASLADTEGAVFEPIVLLARQIVSGTNYEILGVKYNESLAKSETLKVVTIHKDAEGNADLTGTVNFNLNDVTSKDNEYASEEMTGAWEVNSECTAQGDEAENPTDFEKVINPDNINKTYTTLAILGKSVDDENNNNYALLCLRKEAGEDGADDYCYAVATVKQKMSDEPTSLVSVYEIDPAVYASEEGSQVINQKLASAVLPDAAQKAFNSVNVRAFETDASAE